MSKVAEQTKAAYRFFSNAQVSEAEILAGHFQSTRDRFASRWGTALILHDTTEFVYYREDSSAIGLLGNSIAGRDNFGRRQNSCSHRVGRKPNASAATANPPIWHMN